MKLAIYIYIYLPPNRLNLSLLKTIPWRPAFEFVLKRYQSMWQYRKIAIVMLHMKPNSYHVYGYYKVIVYVTEYNMQVWPDICVIR